MAAFGVLKTLLFIGVYLSYAQNLSIILFYSLFFKILVSRLLNYRCFYLKIEFLPVHYLLFLAIGAEVGQGKRA